VQSGYVVSLAIVVAMIFVTAMLYLSDSKSVDVSGKT
jgi:hypothetical protein